MDPVTQWRPGQGPTQRMGDGEKWPISSFDFESTTGADPNFVQSKPYIDLVLWVRNIGK